MHLFSRGCPAFSRVSLVEGLEAIAEVGHSVVQQDVDPVALRLVVGVPFSCDDSLVATVGCGYGAT